MTILLWGLRISFLLIALFVYSYFRYNFARPIRYFVLFRICQDLVYWSLLGQQSAFRFNFEWFLHLIELCWLMFIAQHLCKINLNKSFVLNLPFPVIVAASILNLPFYKTGLQMTLFESAALIFILVMFFTSMFLCKEDRHANTTLALTILTAGYLTSSVLWLNFALGSQIIWMVVQVLGFFVLSLAVLSFEPDVDTRRIVL